MMKIERVLEKVNGRLIFVDKIIEQKSDIFGREQYFRLDEFGRLIKITIRFLKGKSITIRDVGRYDIGNLSSGPYQC